EDKAIAPPKKLETLKSREKKEAFAIISQIDSRAREKNIQYYEIEISEDDKKQPRSDQLQITNYINVFTPCFYKRQEEITKKLVEFIIQYVQPLYILQVDAFQNLLLTCEPGYRIPCDKTVKGILYSVYEWSKEQLRSLLSGNITVVHLTTDLWTAKSRDGYLGVTATWLTAEFEFREALLICNHLPYPYTSEVISDELSKIIEEWDLSSKVFVIATDNGINMLKQGQKLRTMQQKHSQQGHQLPENEHTNPLEVLTDVKTRLIYIDLLSKPDRASKKEGKKLERLCLSLEEREFLQQMISLLEPIERITRKICGAMYPTINLINPYMDLLKNFFAP
ncbi:9096_t:CDS:2, partial [Gigaspora rosea]